MNDFFNFVFESGISMGLFAVLYLVFLQRETFFRTNRFFLLFALLFSFVLPFLHFRVFNSTQATLGSIAGQQYSILLESVSVYGTSVSQSFIQSITASKLLIAIYVMGVAFFAFRFVIRLIQISLIIRRNKIVYENNVRLVVLEKDVSPFSFLSYVFAGANNKQQYGWDKMLIHEIEHVKQRHTIDILILEIISVVQWFNPFFWLLKRMLKENHEYLADRAVLKQDNNTTAYRQVLLSQLIGVHLNMTNNFNYSIKKRMMMMTKIKSSKIASIKLFSGLLLVVALLIVFACNENNDVVDNNANTTLKSAETSTIIMDDVLMIVNGEVYEREFLSQIDPNSIESMTVTKDNLGTYIEKYGDAANNGVIDIILKEGATFDTDNTGVQLEIASSAPKIDSPNKSKEYNDVFVIVEEMPQYPGGQEALREYLQNNLEYPVIALDAGIEGKVYVTFVVEMDGSVGRARIARGVDENLDAEALRVVLDMPRWTPGRQGGQAVAVNYTVPISYKLQ